MTDPLSDQKRSLSRTVAMTAMLSAAGDPVALEALMSEFEDRLQWLPMAQAPKDGRNILAWGPASDEDGDYEALIVVSWDEASPSYPWKPVDSDGNWSERAFTHFMLIPEPPRSA